MQQKTVRIFCIRLIGAVLAVAVGAISRAETVSLKLAPTGTAHLTPLRPRELSLTAVRPPEVKRLPHRLTAPLYTTLTLGPREHPTRFTVLLDAPEGQPSRLFVDANANGDLTDDPAPEWIHKTYTDHQNEHLITSSGGVTLQVPYGKETLPMRVTLTRNDTTEPARIPEFLPLYCTSDYVREGTAALNGRNYHFWIQDALTRGDFRGTGITGQSGIFLLIDVNANGKIDPRGEIYDAAEPFNLGGVTYEIRGLDAGGSQLEFAKSSRSVAEILPPPDLSVGKPAPPFAKTTTDGRRVSFPGDYHGKVVLLYFWATWCGDCNREVPYVVRAYLELHPLGLEILGVSLDHPDQSAQLAAYTKAHAMEWPEIYDGKVWQAEIAQLYFVRHTPTPLLIEGDTGTILAGGSDLMGDKLADTVKTILRGRQSKQP